MASADTKTDIVKSISVTQDLKSELCTTLSNERLRSVMSQMKTDAPYKMRIWFATQSTSAAATPQAAVIALDPSVSPEFTAMAGLFAEFRVTPHAGCRYLLSWSGAPNTQVMVIAFDPSLGVALSNNVQGMESKQHSVLGFGPTFTGPAAMNKDGFKTFGFDLPTGVVTNGSVAGLANAGQWQSTNSSAPKYGYLRTYIPNGPSGVTSTFQMYTWLDVEFRSRH
jgi:hypothetical protein